MEKLKPQDCTAVIPCSNCNLQGNTATVRCLDCDEFFCDACHKSHNALKSMKKHKVVALADRTSETDAANQQDAQKCDRHPSETPRFYCEKCHRLICKDCIATDQHCGGHDYVGVEEAAKKQRTRLFELSQQCAAVKSEYQDELRKTEALKDSLSQSVLNAQKKLERKKTELKREIDDTIDKEKGDIRLLGKKRNIELNFIAGEFQTTLAKFENACDTSAKVTETGSDYVIASVYPTLSASLKALIKIPKPIAAEEELGYVGVKVLAKAETPVGVKRSRDETWKDVAQFSTKPELDYPSGITVHPNGELIAVTNGYEKQAKIFTKDGDLKCSFEGTFDAWLYDVAITPDNRFVLPGKGELLLYDNNGIHLDTAPTYDTNNKPSNPGTLAVDPRGRIIAGLYGNTISIHHGDGRLISKFPTLAERRYLDVTSKGDIAVSFADDTLQVIDYSGDLVKLVQRPPGVHHWNPCAVCCSKQGELFVVNWDDKAVYRYTADGDECLGQIIQDLHNPQGIAITEDGRHLFVAEFSHHMIKIFERQ